MRVLHLIETLGRGGAEQVLVNLLPELKSLGTDVEIAVLWEPYDLQEDLELEGIPVHCFNFPKRRIQLSNMRILKHFVRDKQFNIIHTHLLFSGLYTWLSNISNISCCCVTFHNLAYEKGCNPYNWKTYMVKQLNKLAMHHGMDSYIAVSKAVATHYQQHLGLQNIKVIPNGIPYTTCYQDILYNKQNVRAKYDIDENTYLILMPGRLVREKGHGNFLNAINSVSKKCQNIKAIIIGDGPLKNEIQSLIETTGLSRIVSLHPSIPHQDLLKLLGSANLVVTPSLFEGFGLATGEAMAMGTPVIASNVGGYIDLIEDGISGILVQPNSPKMLTDAIVEVIENPDYANQMVIAAKERIASLFDSPSIATQLFNYYQSLSINTN